MLQAREPTTADCLLQVREPTRRGDFCPAFREWHAATEVTPPPPNTAAPHPLTLPPRTRPRPLPRTCTRQCQQQRRPNPYANANAHTPARVLPLYSTSNHTTARLVTRRIATPLPSIHPTLSSFRPSSSTDNTIRLWDVRAAKPLRSFKGHLNTCKSFVKANFGGLPN